MASMSDFLPIARQGFSDARGRETMQRIQPINGP
jgi:hypothetical protein